MNDISIIAEADVTNERIMEILEGLFYSASKDEQGDIFASEGGINFWIRISKEMKILRIFTVYMFEENSTQEQRLSFTNRATIASILKIGIIENDSFYSDFVIFFSGGLITANLVFALRRFSALVPLIISQQDIENIVK